MEGASPRGRCSRTLGGAGNDVDLLYAVTLMVAVAAGVIATLSAVLGLIKPSLRMQSDARIWKFLSSHRLTNGALVLGFISLATSVFVHSRWGHGSGTVAPMDFGRLLSEHQAFPTVGAILIFALVLAHYRSRRQRHPSAN